MTKLKGFFSSLKPKDSDGSRILFVVFEQQQKKKNLLVKETSRHRLAYAQAKNPKANIIRADVMAKVAVGHNMSVTSDKPTFMAIDTAKGTFREHKGKLTNTELNKFVRQVQSGHLNVVRKLDAALFKEYASFITKDGSNTIGAIIGFGGKLLGVSGGEFSLEDLKAIAKFMSPFVHQRTLKIQGTTFIQIRFESGVYSLVDDNGGVSIRKTKNGIVVGYYNFESSNLKNSFKSVLYTAELLNRLDF